MGGRSRLRGLDPEVRLSLEQVFVGGTKGETGIHSKGGGRAKALRHEASQHVQTTAGGPTQPEQEFMVKEEP